MTGEASVKAKVTERRMPLAGLPRCWFLFRLKCVGCFLFLLKTVSLMVFINIT